MTLELGLYPRCHHLVLVTSYCPLFFAPKLNARCSADKPVWGVFRAALQRFCCSLSKLPFFLLQRLLPPSYLGTGAWSLVLLTDKVVSSGILRFTESIENETCGRIQQNTPLWEGLGREKHASQLRLGLTLPSRPMSLWLCQSQHTLTLKGLFENFWCLQTFGHHSLNALKWKDRDYFCREEDPSTSSF